MLLDRSKPNDQQGFGDYLNELGYKNGFGDIRLFKTFLAKSSKRKYHISCTYSGLVRIISGLFIELGIDQTEDHESARPQCFRCLNTHPQSWIWEVPGEHRCQQILFYTDVFKPPRDKYQTTREEFCGLMMCSAKRLGLNFSPLKEGLYYADILSKEERDEVPAPRIFASHRAFAKI